MADPTHEPEASADPSASSENEVPDAWEVKNISVQLLYSVEVALKEAGGKGKKLGKTKTKTKNETKNKELPFTFQDSSQNYLKFLTAMLKKHSHDDYTPVSESPRFGIKLIVPPKKA